jgi:hypothetical protein
MLPGSDAILLQGRGAYIPLAELERSPDPPKTVPLPLRGRDRRLVATHTHLLASVDGDKMCAFDVGNLATPLWQSAVPYYVRPLCMQLLASGLAPILEPDRLDGVAWNTTKLFRSNELEIFTACGYTWLSNSYVHHGRMENMHIVSESAPVLLLPTPRVFHQTARPDVILAEAIGVVSVVVLRPTVRIAASYAITGASSLDSFLSFVTVLVLTWVYRPHVCVLLGHKHLDGAGRCRVPVCATAARVVRELVAREPFSVACRVSRCGAAAGARALQHGIGAECATDRCVGVGDSDNGSGWIELRKTLNCETHLNRKNSKSHKTRANSHIIVLREKK